MKFKNFIKQSAKGWLAVLPVLALVACSGGTSPSNTPSTSDTGVTSPSESPTQASLGSIDVISREPGSGTRGAFVELVEVVDGKGNDLTREDSEIANSTAVMVTSVAQNPKAIGYISLGALDASVKALSIDGIEATASNVANGSYKISRPFNIVTAGTVDALAEDFIKFILSEQGQKVITDDGYIALDKSEAHEVGTGSGKIAVCGSTSVGPVMEKLAEAYMALNGGLTVEVQQTDSSSGVKDAINATCQIGMSSRELKDSEIADGASATKIATDGIAVIVNLTNPLAGLNLEQVNKVYLGEISEWSQLG